MRFSRFFPPLRYFLPVALAIAGAALCLLLIPNEKIAVAQQLSGFPDSDAISHQARPWILAVLCFLPALASLIYAFANTADRYISRQFLGVFGICLGALFLIWCLIDLSDNLSDFRGSKGLFRAVLNFYTTRLPAVFLMLLPHSLLLSLLYSLGKLSGSREIIAMIQAGRGIVRITLPVMLAGVFFCALSVGLNYHWAPIAEGSVEQMIAEAANKKTAVASHVLYRNSDDRRLWMIGSFPSDFQFGNPLLDVEITTTNPDQSIASRLFAKRAFWNPQTHDWTFEEAIVGTFEADQRSEIASIAGATQVVNFLESPTPLSRPGLKFTTVSAPLVVTNFSESPSQLIRPGLSARHLGIPDLNSWLLANDRHHQNIDPSPYLTQWHYRWALPFACMVTIILATPLAIHFSRRGSGGGIFVAVILSALLLLVTNISLALGEAGTIRPLYAAWLPNALFMLLGLYLFQRRISGRPIYQCLRFLLPSNG
jgi:lipopolysaccharide export system permease protein